MVESFLVSLLGPNLAIIAGALFCVVLWLTNSTKQEE